MQKILIVDDNPRNLELLEDILEELNIAIIKAFSGQEALIHIQKNEFSLIFLDVQMPNMDGFELAQLIRQNPKNNFTPIIFLTAVYSEDVHINKGYLSGAIDFIIKPVNPLILIAKARQIIEFNRQHRLINLQKAEILRQKNIILAKNKDLTDSLNYATRIQKAILPPDDFVKKTFPESFVLYKPKDIVSGDFYWIKNRFNQAYIAVADCTGHGVPGALLSVVGTNELNHASEHYIHPHEILNRLNRNMYEALHYHHESGHVLDGMDVALCFFDFDDMMVEFSGAMSSIYHVRGQVLTAYKGDKVSIGSSNEKVKSFSGHLIDIEKGDIIYLFSDGYPDQFGGEDGKKLRYDQFRNYLLSIQHHPMNVQKEMLEKYFMEWSGNYEQVDDVLVVGIRI